MKNFHGQARSSIQLTFGLAGSMDLEFEQLDSSLPSFLVTWVKNIRSSQKSLKLRLMNTWFWIATFNRACAGLNKT